MGVSAFQQSFGTFTPQDESEYTEVLSKRNVRKQQHKQQQQQLAQVEQMSLSQNLPGIFLAN